jgi:hypothetical protein
MCPLNPTKCVALEKPAVKSTGSFAQVYLEHCKNRRGQGEGMHVHDKYFKIQGGGTKKISYGLFEISNDDRGSSGTHGSGGDGDEVVVVVAVMVMVTVMVGGDHGNGGDGDGVGSDGE